MEKTIIKINASGLKYMTCPFRMWSIMIDGYYQEGNSAKMVYGIAVHKYIDTMFKTRGHMGKAREAAIAAFNKPKSEDKKQLHMSDQNHMLLTCYGLWEDWVLKDNQLDTVVLPDGLPATEVTFSIKKYYEDDFIQVDLEGTIDRLGKVKNGIYVVNDWKTTSTWDVRSYLSKYIMSGQLRFYILALKLMHEREPESQLGQIGGTNVGACIDGIFIKPKACDNQYARSDVFQFPDLVEFRKALDQTILDTSRVVKEQREGKSPLKAGLVNGTCEGRWGMCGFWNICKVQDDKISKVLLDRDFKKKPYNPLNHNEEL